jgi:hypothetical protein
MVQGDEVVGFKQAAKGAIDVGTKSGKTYSADIVFLLMISLVNFARDLRVSLITRAGLTMFCWRPIDYEQP